MNLIKSLQNIQTQRAQQPIPGQAMNLKKMLAAKSGKAGTTTGPLSSNIQEQQALSDFEQQATQQQQAAQLDVASQQLAQQQQEQRQTQAQQQLSTKRQQQTQQYDQQVQKVANNLNRFKDNLKSKEGQQALAEVLFTRKLADQKYLTELKRQGIQRRLEDAQAFELEAGKAAFGNMKELFQSDAEFQQMLDMDMADFRKEMANMSVDAARSVVQSSIQSANESAKWGALGSLSTAGIQAGSTKYTTTDSGGVETDASFFQRMSSGKPLSSEDN